MSSAADGGNLADSYAIGVQVKLLTSLDEVRSGPIRGHQPCILSSWPALAAAWVAVCVHSTGRRIAEQPPRLLRPQEISGEVFAYDKATGCLVLLQPGSTPFHHNLRMLKTSFVKTVRH